VQNEAGDKESVPLTGVEATVIDRLEDICHRCERDPEMMPKCETCGGTGRRWADPIRDAVADLLEQLTTIAGASRRISKRYYQVYGTERKARQRQDDTQGNCDACGRVITGEESDRSKSGFCSGIAPSCWEKWRTYRRNHAHHDPVMLRRMFIAARRAELEAEKIPHDEVGRERELRKMGKAG
jgi:hypothetical protein